MIRWSFTFLLLLLWAGPVHAEDEDADDLTENSLGGATGTPPTSATGDASDEAIEAFYNRPYNQLSYSAAEQLGMPPDVVDACRSATQLIYVRKYKEAKRLLETLSGKYPTLGIGPLGEALIYQALMFENYDFRYEKQYLNASKLTKDQLKKGLAEPGTDALENFFGAGIHAIDAIHDLRRSNYLPALNKALDAMKYLDASRKLAPTFSDIKLGDGMYFYWRSVVTKQSKALPDFEDRRAEGIVLMKEAEKEAVFVGPGASLSLAYAYIEERDMRRALDRALYARLSYPDNVINNLTLGRIYTSTRRYEDALRIYDEILVDAPTNQRTHYHRGVVLARLGRYAEAQKEYETYTGYKDVEKEYKGQAYYRLGALYVRQKDPVKARSYFELAIKTSNNEAAKKAIERLDKAAQ